MKSGPTPYEKEGRVVDAAWMDEHMPDLNPEWRPDDEDEAGDRGITARGLMYKGKWLISPERQERTVRLFWVSPLTRNVRGIQVSSCKQAMRPQVLTFP